MTSTAPSRPNTCVSAPVGSVMLTSILIGEFGSGTIASGRNPHTTLRFARPVRGREIECQSALADKTRGGLEDSRPETKFIAGDPRNDATNTLAGLS